MRREVFIAVVVGAMAAAATPAQAATLTLDRGCYLAKQAVLPSGQAITVRGEGFIPSTPVVFTLGSASYRPALSDASGAIAVSLNAPRLATNQLRATRTLVGSDGVNQASAPVELRNLDADIVPRDGDLTRRVRFLVSGFGPLLAALGKSTVQPVFMHVFEPSGRKHATFFLGRTTGPCGDFTSRRRRVFPFAPLFGRWRYRFTTSRVYRRRAVPQADFFFDVNTRFVPR